MANKINFSEVFAKNVLQEFYYKNKKLYLGDNYNLRLPDIYDKTKTIGIEVGQAELVEDFLIEAINNEIYKNKCGLLNSKKLQQSLNSFYNKPLIKKHLKILSLPKTDVVAFFPTPKARKFKVEVPVFVNLIKEKIERAQKGNYKGCKEINLCIVSIYRIRDLPLVKKIAKELKQINQTEFNKIFIILSSSLFVIKDNKIEIIDYSDQEFSNIHYLSKLEHTKLEKRYNKPNKNK